MKNCFAAFLIATLPTLLTGSAASAVEPARRFGFKQGVATTKQLETLVVETRAGPAERTAASLTFGKLNL
jgi:hypothetical protein